MDAQRSTTDEALAYTIRRACDISGLGRTKLYSEIAAGLIEAKSCGQRTLIPARSLRQYIDNLPAAPIKRSEGFSLQNGARPLRSLSDNPADLTTVNRALLGIIEGGE